MPIWVTETKYLASYSIPAGTILRDNDYREERMARRGLGTLISEEFAQALEEIAELGEVETAGIDPLDPEFSQKMLELDHKRLKEYLENEE